MSTPITVGTLAIAKRNSVIFKAGERGVCYEVYTLEDHPGYSFIFESGGYDGFSPFDVQLCLDVLPVVIGSVGNYHFQDVTKLGKDFRRGRFAEAFREAEAA